MNDAIVHRATFEIEIDGQRELVAVALKDGRWKAAATGPLRSRFEAAAIALLSGELEDTSPQRDSQTSAHPAPLTSSETSLAPALQDLVTAVARAGVDSASSSPSVREAFVALKDEHGEAPSLVLARVVGRLRRALSERDVRGASRGLVGLARLASSMESGDGQEQAMWELGATGDKHSVSERDLLEVGRCRLDGFSKRELERRYLLCLRTGVFFKEEFFVSSSAANVRTLGPVPRRLQVGLGEQHDGPTPQRLRLLQYELNADIPGALEQSVTFAETDFAAVHTRVQKQVQRHPGVAEPVALLRPVEISSEGLVDSAGRVLPVFNEFKELDMLRELRQGTSIRWVFGRCADMNGVLAVRPLAACVEGESSLRFLRIQ